MPGLESLHIFAILIAAFVGMALGALWYSPVLFGNAWLSALGKTQEQLGSPAGPMIGSMISCLIAAAAVEFIVVATGATTLFLGSRNYVTGMIARGHPSGLILEVGH